MVNSHGRRVGGFGFDVVFHALTGGRSVSIPRSDLARMIDDKIDARYETIFGDGAHLRDGPMPISRQP